MTENQQQDVNTPTKLYSEHIFLLPFRIKSTASSSINFDSLCANALEDGWQYKSFHPENNCSQYNELVYFHSYVHPALFPKDNSLFSRIFEREFTADSSFLIQLQNGKNFELNVKDISMHLFATHVGILSIRLQNNKYANFDDILLINDFGRRLYPQFLDEITGIEKTKESFLPKKIELKLSSEKFSEELFEQKYFQNDNLKTAEQPQLARYIQDLIGKKNINSYSILSAIDDRMFCICWVGNNKLSQELTAKATESEKYSFETSEQWYKFIFLDSTLLTCQSDPMLSKLINNHTYRRWEKCNNLCGITRYSFMNITDEKDFSITVLKNNLTNIYSKMISLLLAQRASILTFAERAAQISLKEGHTHSPCLAKDIAELNIEFTQFQTNLCFDEVTAQEQGIEQYEMAKTSMRIEKQLFEVKEQIANLDTVANLYLERKRNSKLEKLNILAGIFLPISIAISIWGMGFSFIKDILSSSNHWISAGLLVFSILAAILLTKAILNTLENDSTFNCTSTFSFWKKVVFNPYFFITAIILTVICFIA